MSTHVPHLSSQQVVFSLDGGFRRPLVIRGVLALVAAGVAGAAGSRTVRTFQQPSGVGRISPGTGGRPAQRDTVRVVRKSGRPLMLHATWVTSWQDDTEFYDKLAQIGQWRHR